MRAFLAILLDPPLRDALRAVAASFAARKALTPPPPTQVQS